MAISYGQFTLWVSVSYVVKSEHSCTSHKPRASYQRWLVRGDLQHEICPHAATQSYIYKYLYPQAVAYLAGSTAGPNVFFNRLIEPTHSKQL